MHPPGTYISAKSRVAAHCGRCGTLGAKTHKIKDGGRNSFFIFFARLVAIIGGSNSKNCTHSLIMAS